MKDKIIVLVSSTLITYNLFMYNTNITSHYSDNILMNLY